MENQFRTLFFVSYRMDALTKPLQRSNLLIAIIMIKLIYLLHSACERLFDELVKEWLQNRYSIVSGTFRVIDGRKVQVRRSHLRRKR